MSDLLKQLNAEVAEKQAEAQKIKVAQKRVQGFIKNSGGGIEPVPGADGTGDVIPVITLNPTEKKQPQNVSVTITGA